MSTARRLSSTVAAHFLAAVAPEKEVFVEAISPLSADAGMDALTFAQGSVDARRESVRDSRAGLMILTPELAQFREGPKIVVENPRLAIAKLARRFFSDRPLPGVAPSALVHANARIGLGAHISEYVSIGPDVTIGRDAVLLDHVVIRGKVRIGDRVEVKPGSIIGAEGFGVEFEADGTPVRIPQIGGVVIGNDVEIGALNTICSGTFSPTVLEDEVKCDDHVHIAHNCVVGRRCILTAGAVLSGSVTLGQSVWIGPNAAVMNKASIGAGTLIGLGAVVTKTTEDRVVVAGNPAKVIRKR